jgi:hypothetical protein
MPTSIRILVLLLSVGGVMAGCGPSAPAAAPADATTPPVVAAKMPAATVIASPALPLASPRDAIKAAMDRFLALRSYHATMQFTGAPGGMAGRRDIDFVAPDRYRMQTPMGTEVIVGDTMYMQVHGRAMRVPMPAGSLSQWRDPVRLAEAEAGMTVDAQGQESVDGVAAAKFHVRHAPPHASDMTLWINGDGLPIRIRTENSLKHGRMTSTVDYSRFDDPTIQIAPPR